MRSRLSYRVAAARNCLSLLKQRAAAGPAAVAAVLFLVFFDGDDGLDGVPPQPGAVRAGRVCLVRHRAAGPLPWPAQAAAMDADRIHQGSEVRRVAVLACAGQSCDGAAAQVSGKVDLGGQPAAGPADRFPADFLSIAEAPCEVISGRGAAGSGRMLIGPGDRGIGAYCPVLALGLIALGPQPVQDLLPGPVQGPAAMPVVDGFPVPETLGQVPPRAARPGTEEDPLITVR